MYLCQVRLHPDIFWFDNDKFSKWCVEGAVSNLLCQLLSIEDAAKFKQIVMCNGEKLITAMNEQSIPKIVLSKTGQIDAVEKCMWILKQCFNCKRLLFLNPESFKILPSATKNNSSLQLMDRQFQKMFYLKQDKSMLWKSACGY